MIIFHILKQDHRQLSRLFDEILHTSPHNINTRELLFEEMKDLLEHHTKTEEDILYPILKDTTRTHLQTSESYEEHHLMKIVLKELNIWQKNTDDWLGKIKTLKDLQEHHAATEENYLFPQAENILNPQQLAEMQTQIENSHEEYIQERSHPSVWGKVYFSMRNDE